MANRGLKKFLHAPLNENEGTYGDVEKLAGAISYKENINLNSYKHYEDDELKFEDTSFASGTINLGIGDDDEDIFSVLLGKQKKTVKAGEKNIEMYASATEDISIPVGFGFIQGVRLENSLRYMVKFYPKVVFKPYSTEGKTATDSVEYTTPSVDGTIYTYRDDYKYEKRFDTVDEAVEALYACFGKAVPQENNLNEGETV